MEGISNGIHEVPNSTPSVDIVHIGALHVDFVYMKGGFVPLLVLDRDTQGV